MGNTPHYKTTLLHVNDAYEGRDKLQSSQTFKVFFILDCSISPSSNSVFIQKSSTCLLKQSGPLLRMRSGTVELKGVAGPAALLSGNAGASVSVGIANRRLGGPAVVAAAGTGEQTEGGGTGAPPKHEDTRWRTERLEREIPPGPPHRLWDST